MTLASLRHVAAMLVTSQHSNAGSIVLALSFYELVDWLVTALESTWTNGLL